MSEESEDVLMKESLLLKLDLFSEDYEDEEVESETDSGNVVQTEEEVESVAQQELIQVSESTDEATIKMETEGQADALLFQMDLEREEKKSELYYTKKEFQAYMYREKKVCETDKKREPRKNIQAVKPFIETRTGKERSLNWKTPKKAEDFMKAQRKGKSSASKSVMKEDLMTSENKSVKGDNNKLFSVGWERKKTEDIERIEEKEPTRQHLFEKEKERSILGVKRMSISFGEKNCSMQFCQEDSSKKQNMQMEFGNAGFADWKERCGKRNAGYLGISGRTTKITL